MPFRFRLETILRLRENLEHREELLLQSANQRVVQLRSQIEACLRELEERSASQRSRLGQGAFAAEIQFELAGDESIRNRRKVLSAELKKAEQARDHQRDRYQKVRRDRETLESIRRRQLEEHTVTEKRRAQRTLDDLALMRREFLRRGDFA
jgi:flagellar export protein FliJ